MNDPSRTKRQKGLVNDWAVKGFAGTVEATTGFGKSRVGLLAIQGLLKKGLLPAGLSVGIVVPSNYLKGQWEELLTAAGLADICRVRTVQSLFSVNAPPLLNIHFLILDEVHWYTAEVFSQLFAKITYSKVLGLSGTVPHEQEKRFVIDLYCPVIDRVMVQECVENGWVSPFTVYNLAVNMSPEEQAQYKAFNTEFHKYFAVFSHNFTLAMACLQDQTKRKQYASKIGWDPKAIMVHAVNWRKAMNGRMELLYNLGSKQEAVQQILDHFSTYRTVTFAQTTEAADQVVQSRPQVDAVVYHASMPKKLRDGNLAQFRDPLSPVRILSTAKALDEGADLPEVDLILIVSGTSSSRQSDQRRGRGIRYVEGKHAVIIELYAIGTQDMTWLKSRQKNVPKDRVVWSRSLDEVIEAVEAASPSTIPTV